MPIKLPRHALFAHHIENFSLRMKLISSGRRVSTVGYKGLIFAVRMDKLSRKPTPWESLGLVEKRYEVLIKKIGGADEAS